MRKLFVDNKGQVVLKEVRVPYLETKGSIVKTKYALISSGTELFAIRMKKFENLSLIKKFFTSKEFRNIVLNIIKIYNLKGILNIIKFYKEKTPSKNFASPSINLLSIGYSCSGIVQKTSVKNYNFNDRVACSGSNHAEVIFSPKNLTCKVPDNVSLEEAAFVALGAIALHSVHRADIKPGDNVGIIGTGLIGLLVIQLAKLSGAKVFGFDLINRRLNLAKKLGADLIINPRYYNALRKVNEITKGHGLDSIIICATSKSPKPLEDAVDLIRDKGKIVMVGAFPITIDRSKVYYKEIDLLISRSYGPGRYDTYYEYEGFDYPKEYVPFTEKRNMELFLQLISEKKVDVKSLISDIIPAEEANKAYEKLDKDPISNIAIILKLTQDKEQIEIIQKEEKFKKEGRKLKIGLIGCGSFAQEVHLPYLVSNPDCRIKGICTQHQKTAIVCKEKYRPDYVTTNYKKIIKDPEIETIFIYTKHNTHEKFTVKALKAGKNVYVEKPMGITWEECTNVYSIVKETGKFYTIGFNRRYSPHIQLAKELLKERSNPIIINYRISSTFILGKHWIYDPNIGGGPLIGELCHFTDLILYLIGSNPIELIARGGNLSHKNIDTYDNCVVVIKFQNGSIANIIYSDLNGPKMSKERIEIYSGESAIIIDDFLKMETSGFNMGNLLLPELDKGHKNEINHVLKANLKNKESLVNVDDAIKAMDLCFKVIESIRANKNIKDFK